MLNALFAGLNLRVGEISESVNKESPYHYGWGAGNRCRCPMCAAAMSSTRLVFAKSGSVRGWPKWSGWMCAFRNFARFWATAGSAIAGM